MWESKREIRNIKSMYQSMPDNSLIKAVNLHRKNASWYKGSKIPSLALAELRRRKKMGLIPRNAGVKRRSSNRRSSGGFNLFNFNPW